MSGVRVLAVALALLAGAACTSDSTTSDPPGSPVAIPSVDGGGAETAKEAIAELCVPPDLPEPEPVEAGDLPPEIDALIADVEAARGLAFLEPPAAEAIGDEEMDRRLEESFDTYYPRDLYDRRTVAWRTIGVIPPDADLLEAYRTYLTGQVIGFYDPQTGELVYLGEGDELGLTERLVLAHELTHALDDQHFDLRRLDDLAARCADERFTAALGLVEGSAQHFATAVVLAEPELDLGGLGEALEEAAAAQEALRDVPPFVQALQEWPYQSGQAFVDALALEGGTEAIDAAMRRPPVSTEQVLHPERFPEDVPTRVDVPDLAEALGRRWGDLDAMAVGEEWLLEMLDLRLLSLASADAAAGWDGGVYRAWSDGEDVVVLLQTAWDEGAEARAFATAVDEWAAGGPGGEHLDVVVEADRVRVTFATSERLLEAATAALPS